VGVGDLEEALLLTGFVEVEGGDDHYPCWNAICVPCL
jgi:hypothetical protein